LKKLISVLLVLTMVLAIAGSAMAATKFTLYKMVEFKCDSSAYNAAKASKKTNNVVAKGSVAQVRCVSGKFVKLRVNRASKKEMWFKACDLKNTDKTGIKVVWAKGGRGMSSRNWSQKIFTLESVEGFYVKVSGHTNLRKTPSLHCKSQAVVEKCTLLKATGRWASDDRGVNWEEVCYKGKKLWVSDNFLYMESDFYEPKYYDKDGKRIYHQGE
jgi:hypothetical protein